MEEATNKRTRMNLSISTKGIATFDVTAEYDTPEETAEKLGQAVDLIVKTAKEKGLILAGPA